MTDIKFGAALSAMYIFKGYYTAGSVPPHLHNVSELDVADGFIELGEILDHMYKEGWKKNPDGCNGVWDYEVSEPLGRWIAGYVNEHYKLPPSVEVLQYAKSLVDNIFDEPV